MVAAELARLLSFRALPTAQSKRLTFRLSVGYVSLLAVESRPSGFSVISVC